MSAFLFAFREGTRLNYCALCINPDVLQVLSKTTWTFSGSSPAILIYAPLDSRISIERRYGCWIRVLLNLVAGGLIVVVGSVVGCCVLMRCVSVASWGKVYEYNVYEGIGKGAILVSSVLSTVFVTSKCCLAGWVDARGAVVSNPDLDLLTSLRVGPDVPAEQHIQIDAHGCFGAWR